MGEILDSACYSGDTDFEGDNYKEIMELEMKIIISREIGGRIYLIARPAI